MLITQCIRPVELVGWLKEHKRELLYCAVSGNPAAVQLAELSSRWDWKTVDENSVRFFNALDEWRRARAN